VRLLLLHVPKTAGASVVKVARRHYPAGQNVHIRPAFGRAKGLRNEREWMARNTTARQRARSRLVSGHFRWGIDELLPGDSEYAACLRSPEERIVSLYRWLAQSRSPRSREWAAGGIESFIGGNLADVENGTTRMLAARGDVADQTAAGPVTETDYVLAAERLASCPIVGVHDDLPRFVARLASRYHWTCDLTIPKVHVSQHRRPGLSDKAASLLRARNEYDLALYEQAVRCAL
jgi:hypothetical protein